MVWAFLQVLAGGHPSLGSLSSSVRAEIHLRHPNQGLSGLTPENITSQRALVATGKVQNGDYGIITDADSLKANVLELTVYPPHSSM